MCHAINIIDGLNGLASGTCIIILTSIAILSGMSGDGDIKLVALLVLAPTLGFFLLNFPRGLIFLGDGGAYFLGMTVAFVAINLPTRNPEISSFASLLIVSYPIYETMRSYVRRFKKGARHSCSLITCISIAGFSGFSTIGYLCQDTLKTPLHPLL